MAAPPRGAGCRANPAPLNALAVAHGYDTAFWWASAIVAGGAVVAGLLLRRGQLTAHLTAGVQPVQATRLPAPENSAEPA